MWRYATLRGGLRVAALVVGVVAHVPAAAQVRDLIGTGQAVTPSPLVDGTALVARSNARRDRDGVWSVAFATDPTRASLPVVADSRDDAGAMALRALHADGRAAGLNGILYDNRDRGHAALAAHDFPQLSSVRYSPAFMAEGFDYGYAGALRFQVPVLGNSSTARTRGPLARSNGRLALGTPAAAQRSHALYASNHLYVYPEHRDHDAATGDRLFGISPAFLLSQGSSRSDLPVLDTLAMTVAAFRPETQARLIENGLLASTAQMVLRRSLESVESPDDYMSVLGQPVTIRQERLRPEVMVAYANAIEPDMIPPSVHLDVIEDFQAVPGRDYLAANLSEALFTTPSAVARAWRSHAFTRSAKLSAASTLDPNGHALTFHWRLLRGDPRHVRISPSETSGSVASIEMDWHAAVPMDPYVDIRRARIDIAVFADNGFHLSAPAHFSVLLPLHQLRDYRRGADGQVRLVSLSYDVRGSGIYADPTIWPRAAWRDEFEYNQQGRWDGVVRHAHDGSRLVGPDIRHHAIPDADGVLRLRATQPVTTVQ